MSVFFVHSAKKTKKKKNIKRRGDLILPKERSKRQYFIWVKRRMTAQLSVKVTHCHIAKNGLVMKGGKPSRAEVVKLNELFYKVRVHI